MISFELAEPKTLGEAIALLDTEDQDVRPISGGTALMLMLKSGIFRPNRLVSLQKVEPDIHPSNAVGTEACESARSPA